MSQIEDTKNLPKKNWSNGFLIREPYENIQNGLTIFNPLIYGLVSYKFVPLTYGELDSFSFIMTILGVFFIAYLWRACYNSSLPCLTMPYNVAEFILLITLKSNCRQKLNHLTDGSTLLQQNSTTQEIMTTIDAASSYQSFNQTLLHIDENIFGMIKEETNMDIATTCWLAYKNLPFRFLMTLQRKTILYYLMIT
ncbi:uncharacterized protein LOC106644647 [Copidosoma floridanum]|uniref:uncharacterized protein LOC106644647 n=1 Tax=Copidosoma floridanum TaxID=29053 RepID=UPI000C6F7F63|nr:uncharacterized protein LOC106644647 [Copidosoma floridanum]